MRIKVETNTKKKFDGISWFDRLKKIIFLMEKTICVCLIVWCHCFYAVFYCMKQIKTDGDSI